jgi:general secretion pathway protein L
MSVPADFAAPRPVSPWRLKISAFWRWWADELSQLVPERFAALHGAARVPVVAMDREELALVEPRALVGPDTRVDLASLDEARRRGAVRSLLERAGESRARARLCLGQEEALVRRLNMPAATEENLRQVLAFEMDRLTPFRAEEVYFDYRVLARDPAAGNVSVLLAVARRELVDARVEQVRAAGVNVQGVSVRDDAGQGAAALDLLPSEQRGERESAQERLVQRILIVVVFLLVFVALTFPIYRKRAAILSLFPLVNQAAQDAQATDGIARELEKQVADYNFLLAKKHGNYPPIAYLEEVTRLLPDNTWVQQLDVKSAGKGREVQVSGETASSSRLIEILEQSRMLQNATTRGSETRGSQPNTVRFLISAEARPKPLPDSIPVLEMGAGSGTVSAASPVSPQAAPVAAPPAPVSAQPAPPIATVTPVPASSPLARPGGDPKSAGAKPAPGK